MISDVCENVWVGKPHVVLYINKNPLKLEGKKYLQSKLNAEITENDVVPSI